MKKRTVKDFIALYAQEDGEKLVLIQSGTSADKTFLDTYWAAHTHALAMADVQTGQAISTRRSVLRVIRSAEPIYSLVSFPTPKA